MCDLSLLGVIAMFVFGIVFGAGFAIGQRIVGK